MPEVVYYVLIFAIGLCVGSFLNVLLFRLNKKKGMMFGRSECPHCLHKLAWHDLAPIISFLILAGKCRYCRKKISLIYPIVETTTGLVFLLFSIKFGLEFSPSFLIQLAILSLFIFLAFFDYLYMLIPDKILIILFALAFIYNFAIEKSGLTNSFLTGLAMASVFVIMYLVSRGKWMGLGDAKLIFLIGFLFGYPLGLLAITASIWFAAFFGIALVALKKANLKTALPLGTFLSIVSILFIIFQNDLQFFKLLT